VFESTKKVAFFGAFSARDPQVMRSARAPAWQVLTILVAGALLCNTQTYALSRGRGRSPAVVHHPLASGSQATNLAVPLASQDFEVQQGSQSVTDTGEDSSGRPLTIAAAPLDPVGGSDSLLSSESGSSSGSSWSESSRMWGTSMSGSSGPTPLPGSGRRCIGADGITPGPCGGGGPLTAAKIVPTLSGGKKFAHRLHGDGIWTFKDGADVPQERGPAVTPADVQHVLDADSVLAQLQLNLEKLENRMSNEKVWVEDVKTIIAHYKQKIGAVLNGLKNEGQEIKHINRMINERKKLAQRKALELKLMRVNEQLQRLQLSTSNVSGESQSLKQVQRALKQSIQTIQGDIARLRR